jgi:hypothetical protein
MPTVTLTAEADVSTISSGEGAGVGDHLPVGYWSGYHFKSAVRFPLPAGWTAWSSITSAVLNITTSDFYHVGVRSSGIYIRRQAVASLWTKAQGSSDCESSFSSSNTTGYSDLAASTAGQVSLTSGTTANSKKSPTVTALVEYYRTNGASKIVFVIDAQDSNDYTEFWSRDTTKDATLTITYVDQSPPNAPTLVAPAAGATVDGTLTPTFSWTHNDPQGDAQDFADVELADNAGTVLSTQTVTGAANSLVWPSALTRGLTYKWRVRTSDAVSGYGAWSAQITFTIRANPVVTVSATRVMTFDAVNHQPRLVVSWTADQPQSSYRVQTSSGYDSGTITGPAQTHTLARNLTSGTAETVTVTVTSTYATTGSASQAFTPRWGLTTHRKDLTTAPVDWLTPVVVSTVPTGASLVIEYGSDTAANAVPVSGWLSSLSAAPKSRYVYWRAWFIPSATAGPTLSTLTISTNNSVTLVDKWGTTRDVEALAAPWAIDPGEAVYGTRSMSITLGGASPYRCYSFAIKVRAGRSYILTGLMKSQGNSGARFQLEDAAGTILTGGGLALPVGPVQSPQLIATSDWYTATRNDTNRYRTPVWVAGADMTVYVVLYASGTSGAKAWWDAVKLEESTVATPWSPGAIGATVIDAGGVQVDGNRGGIIRYKGVLAGSRDTVEGGQHALLFAADTEVYSPSVGALQVGAKAVLLAGDVITGPGSGAAFPGSPAANQRFFRTDLGMEFYWNGTRWLSMQVFEANLATGLRVLAPVAASIGFAARWPVSLKGGSDLWLVDVTTEFNIVNGTALSASHKWVAGFFSRGLNSVTDTTFATTNIVSGAVNLDRQDIQTIGALLAAGTPQAVIAVTWTKTGTPGDIYFDSAVNYRVVAT